MRALLSGPTASVGAGAGCFVLALLGLAVTADPVDGHPLAFTETTLTLRADGGFEVDMIVDLDALALGAPQDTDDARLVAAIEALSPAERETLVDRLAILFERRVRVRFDDRPRPFTVTFPDRGTPAATESAIPTVLGLTARLTGRIPPGASTVEFFASRAFSDVHLTVVDEPRDVIQRVVLERGARSDPFSLAGPLEPPSTGAVAGRYLRLGFAHIVPGGADHVLFVLGLFLFSRRLGALIAQVTAFTLAHALTLALGALDVVTLPPWVVEPLIALSIVWIAVENIARRSTGTGRQRAGVVFAFGLLHGLGFAGVLRDLGLPPGERLVGLAAFNVGIELGQLAVIGGAAALLGWCRHRPWYRARVVVPVSALIATAGLGWMLERLVG